MTAAQRGLLLLSCPLGDGLRPLSAAQLSLLYRRMAQLPQPEDGTRELTADDLAEIGCSEELSARILELLERDDLLDCAIASWQRRRIGVCTRLDRDYPLPLRRKLGDDAPSVLFLLGDRSLLGTPCISVVGSRQPRPDSTDFAVSVGRLAAAHGLTLVSGDARGIDRIAQEACLAAGGSVIAFLCDSLVSRTPRRNLLYVSAEGPDFRFSAERALARNPLIHAQGSVVFSVQPRNGIGGTWNGTLQNLNARRTSVILFDDGSEAVRALCEKGAVAVTREQLPALPIFTDPVTTR